MTETSEFKNRPQREQNMPTANARDAMIDYLKANPSSMFQFACDRSGNIASSNPEDHPASGRPVVEAMKTAAKEWFQVGTAFNLAANTLAEEEGRMIGRSAVNGQPILTISADPKYQSSMTISADPKFL